MIATEDEETTTTDEVVAIVTDQDHNTMTDAEMEAVTVNYYFLDDFRKNIFY